LLVLAASALAQNNQKDGQAEPLSTTACQSTFTSGSGNAYLKFCVTQNGNVSMIESPQTFSQIYHGAEGYGLCDTTNNPKVGYNDWGQYGDSGNWQKSIITQPNGPDSFPLTITRTTEDSVFTLKQAFSRSTTTSSVKITMTLKNNSAVARSVYLERFADVDADGTSGSNTFDADKYASWGHLYYGLMMRAKSDPHNDAGFVVTGGPQDSCALTKQQVPYIGDGAAMYDWVYVLGPQSSQTAVLEYRPL
jgi:hypothetical protein